MKFDDHFSRDSDPRPQKQDIGILKNLESVSPGISEFLATRAGNSYEKSLYRIFSLSDVPKWNEIVADALPEVKGSVFCFSYDWLGRIFALGIPKGQKDETSIFLLEPGTGDVLQVPTSLVDFHNHELVDLSADCLSRSFYEDWRLSGGKIPSPQQCVGYETPLFLGGEDNCGNLEITDMEVYWSICGQLLTQTRDLPEGTRIGNVDIEE